MMYQIGTLNDKGRVDWLQHYVRSHSLKEASNMAFDLGHRNFRLREAPSKVALSLIHEFVDEMQDVPESYRERAMSAVRFVLWFFK